MTVALVIGGGTNGMACAFRLADAGMRVTVIEAADRPGGGAATADFAPGFRVPALAHLVAGLDARVTAAMDLARHGLTFAATDIATTALSMTGTHVTVRGGMATGPDAAAYAALHARLAAFATALAPFRQMTPPRLKGPGNEWTKLAKLALGLRRMGKVEFREFLRMILTNVADVAEDDLTDPLLQGVLSFDATLGAWTGPRSPNSLILLLNRLSLGPLSFPSAGPGAVARAMAAALAAKGVDLRTGAGVARIDTDNHRASGVTLSSGETLTADIVVSTIAPVPTFRDLVGPRALDAGFYTRSGQIRARGAAAKLHLALTGAPEFRGADLTHRLVVAPTVDAVETAWNPVKYGKVPDRPVMEIVVPSAFEPGWAPDGQHTLSAIVQFAPHAPPDPDAARAAMLENALRVLEDHAPGLRRLIAHAEMRMPCDIARHHGNPGGQWHHAELSVEQMLFLRPMPDTARYATPLPGLWLAGAGSHPGGWITGTPGWNAAEAILKGAA